MSADLIERLEKATGPDRELANEVLLACCWKADEYGPGPGRYVIWIDPDPNGEDYIDGDQPDPTASLDAARTLILPEHSFGGLAQVSPHDWIMMIFSRSDSKARWEGEAPTAELAVCIAALKARTSAVPVKGE